MTKFGEVPNLIYPHEGIGILHANAQEVGNAPYELAQFAHFLALQTMHIETMDSRVRSFTVANGEIGANILPSKQRFSGLVNEMGYHAPHSVTIDPAEDGGGSKYYGAVVALDESQSRRFCKPANGARGRGARMVETPEDALTYVAEQGEAFLVQSYEKPERDWRYIMHKDSTQLASGEQAGWHVMFKVERPVVVGEGSKSIAELLADSKQVPEAAKRKYIQHHKREALVVPNDGEVVELLQTGNREQGAYRVPHSEVEEQNLDRFMAQFVRDLEDKLGTVIATLCVDMGVKDSGVLLAAYDFDRIRDNVVFYEHQLPFGMKPYLKAIPPEIRWGIIDNLVPAGRRRQYMESQVYMNFVRSVIRSGKYLRSHS